MLAIVTALQCEAQPLIERLRLKQAQKHKKWRAYRSDDTIVVVSGVGKIRAAMAVVWLIEAAEFAPAATLRTINFGSCGSANANLHPRGSLALMNRILDHGTGRVYYPDMLPQHGLTESGVETFDHPVTMDAHPSQPLVDMEASGYFEAASLYLAPDQIYCLKIVSDHLEGGRIADAEVRASICQQWGAIEGFFRCVRRYQLAPADGCLVGDLELLDRVVDHLRLTKAQQDRLRRLAEAYCIRNRSTLEPLTPYTSIACKSKADATRHFDEICRLLSECG